MPWKKALQETLSVTYAALADTSARWALIGSAASALHGCRVEPSDINLLGFTPDVVERFAGLMRRYDHAGRFRTDAPDDSEWRSTPDEPIWSGPDQWGFMWHVGRWQVSGFPIEIKHLAPPLGFISSAAGAGIWEAGSEIWPYVRTLPFAGYQVPVVPLEIQLHSALLRGPQSRIYEMVSLLRRRGYDRRLLEQALGGFDLARFDRMVAGS